jgi:hypothetical protein
MRDATSVCGTLHYADGILSLEDMKIVDAAKELHNCCSLQHMAPPEAVRHERDISNAER